jgi:hypothetical protein
MYVSEPANLHIFYVEICRCVHSSASKLQHCSQTVHQVVASEISLIGTTGARLANTCECKTAERLNAKKIPDKDHEAILEEIDMIEGLDHDEEASLGDAAGDGSFSEEEDGSHSSHQE